MRLEKKGEAMIIIFAELEVHCRPLQVKLSECDNREDFNTFEFQREISRSLQLAKDLIKELGFGFKLRRIVIREFFDTKNGVAEKEFESLNKVEDYFRSEMVEALESAEAASA